MAEKFYLTTTLPYVNAEPHIGFALEIVHADIIARYHALAGDEVFFNTGTDEHGLKIYRKALEEGKDPQKYVDEYAAKFRKLAPALGLYQDLHFIRTTDPKHKVAVRGFWERCDKNGFIYKKPYKMKYCVGCELEKTDSELENGRCPIHPNLQVELIEEENYFFKFSAFQGKLLKLYEKRPDFIVPASRGNEIKAFVERGLEDFSISRLKEKMPWGVPVPNDDSQVIYVWFDALVNYISTLGWPEDDKNFEKFWGTKEKPNAVQMAGKDNLRQQSAMWQAMLMAAGLPTSKQVVIHGFIQSGGQKMSKSLGNVVDPFVIVKEYGTDALRYYLARHMHPFEDGDFTIEKFIEAYNAGLANGIGNLTSRILTMAVQNDIKPSSTALNLFDSKSYSPHSPLISYLDEYQINKAIDYIWKLIAQADNFIQVKQPFKLIKEDKNTAKVHIQALLSNLIDISISLRPFLPETAKKIEILIKGNRVSEKPLFPRIDTKPNA